jgi:hypothetical protein
VASCSMLEGQEVEGGHSGSWQAAGQGHPQAAQAAQRQVMHRIPAEAHTVKE